jgi:hypothetical protein
MLFSLMPFSTAAYAQTIPHYDVNAHCRQVASAVGSYSEVIFSGCMQQEQQSYDSLKSGWLSLPVAMRSHCDAVARAIGPGSYMILKGCIDQEVDAAKSNRSNGFHY